MCGLAADCGRRSFRYTERRNLCRSVGAADCGRRSFRYTARHAVTASECRCGLRPSLVSLHLPRRACHRHPLLRIAAVARFATLSPPTRASRSPLRIAAVARFATLDFEDSDPTQALRIAAVARFATLGVERQPRCRLRIAAVARFATLPARSASQLRVLRIAAVARFATLDALSAARRTGCGLRPSLVSLHCDARAGVDVLRIAAVARFATLPRSQPPEKTAQKGERVHQKSSIWEGEGSVFALFFPQKTLIRENCRSVIVRKRTSPAGGNLWPIRPTWTSLFSIDAQ